MSGFHPIGMTRSEYQLLEKCVVNPEGGDCYCRFYQMRKANGTTLAYRVLISGDARRSGAFTTLNESQVFGVLEERGLVGVFGTAREEELDGEEDQITTGKLPEMAEPEAIRRTILIRLNAIRWLDPNGYRNRGLLVDPFLMAFGIERRLFCQQVISTMEKGYVTETRGHHGQVWFMYITERGIELAEARYNWPQRFFRRVSAGRLTMTNAVTAYLIAVLAGLTLLVLGWLVRGPILSLMSWIF